jgi:hypothetical protein
LLREFASGCVRCGKKQTWPGSVFNVPASCVIDMTNTVSHLGNEFNAFLFAPIGEARNGMLLSVLSALARQDVDPWGEAAELARLPKESAVRRLTSFIAALPDGLDEGDDAPTVAARLIALLPRSQKIEISPRAVFAVPSVLANSKSAIYMMIFMAFILGTQAFLASRFESQTRPPHLSSTSAGPTKSHLQVPKP